MRITVLLEETIAVAGADSKLVIPRAVEGHGLKLPCNLRRTLRDYLQCRQSISEPRVNGEAGCRLKLQRACSSHMFTILKVLRQSSRMRAGSHT